MSAQRDVTVIDYCIYTYDVATGVIAKTSGCPENAGHCPDRPGPPAVPVPGQGSANTPCNPSKQYPSNPQKVHIHFRPIVPYHSVLYIFERKYAGGVCYPGQVRFGPVEQGISVHPTNLDTLPPGVPLIYPIGTNPTDPDYGLLSVTLFETSSNPDIRAPFIEIKIRCESTSTHQGSHPEPPQWKHNEF